MYQNWRDLLFLHWRVPPENLAPSIPDGLEIETFDGSAWIGIVPFLMRGVRPRFLPTFPGLSDFHELNVRTYVVDEAGRPGVWFYSLDADQSLAVRIARRFFHLPYEHARMSHQVSGDETIDYACCRKGRATPSEFRYRPLGSPREATPGTLEFFLLERYLLYSWDARRERLFEGRVHHRPYPFQNVTLERHDALAIEWDGLRSVVGPPVHAAFSAGVDVEVFPLRRAESSR